MSAVNVLRVMRKGEAYCRDAGDIDTANSMKNARAALEGLFAESHLLLKGVDYVDGNAVVQQCDLENFRTAFASIKGGAA